MELTTLQEYCESLKSKFALPGAVSPEDQLKPAVAELIEAAGSSCGLKVDTLTEAHLFEIGARPDLAVYVNSLICGYVELKSPGLGADAQKLSSPHNKAQWEKLKGLPNLIYTDGSDWALYRYGERPEAHPIVRFRDNPLTKGKDAVTQDDADALKRLFSDFLGWKPNVPHKPETLAQYLAPLARFLRFEVESALAATNSAVGLLANEWRQYFFPDADDAQFADAYAQTVTYAMLLARLSGAEKLEPAEAAKILDKNNGLLARTLELLGQKDAKKELCVGFELLQRSLEALNPHDFLKSKPDLWLYFYEDFLAAYDSKLRKDYGVYYTPREVVELQIRLASELLETRFGKTLGFADDGVVLLDPAVGTGTYPVAAIMHGLEKVRQRSGPGAVPARGRLMAQNMYGFEILVGPYAVAHLRLTQTLESAMNSIVVNKDSREERLSERLKIYLADTLESPHAEPPGGLTLTHAKLTQEHEAARTVKLGGNILVCLGNPPYDRQNIDEDDNITQRKGGWVRFGDKVMGGANPEMQGERPIFSDFTEPGTKTGAGLHLKNLYNDYVYFWRWALWRLFEQQNCGGIVTFITASSYLTGPGFVGVREAMRRNFDNLWVIDLGGDNIGTRKTPNVFNIKTPVAIAIGVRAEKASPKTPAKTCYVKIEGKTRDDKLKKLERILKFSDLTWRECLDDWHKPFVPVGKGDFFQWPALIDLFPYQRSGSKFGRAWPIGETEELIKRRWRKLIDETGTSRARYFKNNKYRKIERQYKDHMTGDALPTLSSLKIGAETPKISIYSFRSYDRHLAIEDIRFNDRMGEILWKIQGEKQLYFSTMATKILGYGQAIMVTPHVPDLDCFCGRGGKDVIPLYCDVAGNNPNLTSGLLDALGKKYGIMPSVEDFAAYVYALLGGQSYTRRYWNELETPGPRIPITKSADIFSEVASLGRHLIWLHTYSKYFLGEGRDAKVPTGKAKCLKSISDIETKYPEKYFYDDKNLEIVVGEGRFGPVAPDVWNFEVSGLKVVQSWLGYRMKRRSGKKSSPLDDIRPERWTPRMSDEFLELLWVLEATLSMEPALEEVLDKVVASPCFTASEFPQPTEMERKQPDVAASDGGLLGIMGFYDKDDD